MRFPWRLAAWALLSAAASGSMSAEDRNEKVHKDRDQFAELESWIYNDLDQGIKAAREADKPLLIVFRCIPCEACQEFDDQVARRDPAVRELMDQFVCVRIPQANAIDLGRFQFDFDQSFAVCLMNADGTQYGRFGTRSNRGDESRDISLVGLNKALKAALEMHRDYAAITKTLPGKQVTNARFKSPRDYPSLAGEFENQKYKNKIDYASGVAGSCLHCHQIGEAERLVYRSAGKPIPDNVLFPYPNPTVLGLTLDPKETAVVAEVADGSSAARDGFQPGDRLLTLAGQPLLSIADVQWVLHNAPADGELPALIERNGGKKELGLSLADGWRRGDISWRATTWDLRRMGLGGLYLVEPSAEERRAAGVADDQLALKVEHAGEYGDHATAKNAGVRNGDIVVAFDGLTKKLTESDLLAHAVQRKKPGDMVALTVVREGKRREMKFSLQ